MACVRINVWTMVIGAPQCAQTKVGRTGSVGASALLSPLLASIYLHELDVEMREAGLVMVRYADDAVVLCRSDVPVNSGLTQYLLLRMQAGGLFEASPSKIGMVLSSTRRIHNTCSLPISLPQSLSNI